jgi:hypothetical protein
MTITANCDLGLDTYLLEQEELKSLRKEVEKLNKRLLKEIKTKSYWKCKYEKIRPSRYLDLEKKNKALDMIVAFDSGDKSKSLLDIAFITGINYSTVTSIARVYRQAII